MHTLYTGAECCLPFSTVVLPEGMVDEAASGVRRQGLIALPEEGLHWLS